MQEQFAEQGRQIEELRTDMNQKFDMVFGLLDERYKQVEIDETERVAEISQINHIDRTVENHEERITTLEEQVA